MVRCRRSQAQSHPTVFTGNLQVAPASKPRRPSEHRRVRWPPANKGCNKCQRKGRLSPPHHEHHHDQQGLKRLRRKWSCETFAVRRWLWIRRGDLWVGQRYLNTNEDLMIPWVAWTKVMFEIRWSRCDIYCTSDIWQHSNRIASSLGLFLSMCSYNVLANISIKTLKIKQSSKIWMHSSLRAQKVLKLRSTNAWRMPNICMINCRGGQTSSWSLILKWVRLSEENVLSLHISAVWMYI